MAGTAEHAGWRVPLVQRADLLDRHRGREAYARRRRVEGLALRDVPERQHSPEAARMILRHLNFILLAFVLAGSIHHFGALEGIALTSVVYLLMPWHPRAGASA